jgi:four helix bundle protein
MKQAEQTTKKYDLEERTASYAERVRDFVLKLPKNKANDVYAWQLIRSGSSPGANYIEANESIGDKDFVMKVKTCRREAKESAYWLRLVILDGNLEMGSERKALQQEATELVLIFSAILRNRLQKPEPGS